MPIKTTRTEFEAYEKVRASGRWTMLNAKALRATKLDERTYFRIIKNYDLLKRTYSQEEKAT